MSEKEKTKDVEDEALEEVSGGEFDPLRRKRPITPKRRSDAVVDVEVPVDEKELEDARGGVRAGFDVDDDVHRRRFELKRRGARRIDNPG